MVKGLFFFLFFFYSAILSFGQTYEVTQKRNILVAGIDFGFLQIKTKPLYPDTTSFKFSASEIDYYIGGFPLRNTMVGVFYSRFKTKSTNKTFPLKTGFGYQIRQYFSLWDWQWKFSESRFVKKIEGRPYVGLTHQFTNVYTDTNNDLIKINSHDIQEIFPRIGTSIKIYKPFWFNLAMGTIYQPNFNEKRWLFPIWTTSIEIILKK